MEWCVGVLETILPNRFVTGLAGSEKYTVCGSLSDQLVPTGVGPETLTLVGELITVSTSLPCILPAILAFFGLGNSVNGGSAGDDDQRARLQASSGSDMPGAKFLCSSR